MRCPARQPSSRENVLEGGQQQEGKLRETKQRVKDLDRYIMQAEIELKQTKAEWQAKVKETDAKMVLREKQVMKR